MRVSVRVYPGSRRNEVGGRYGEKEPPVLKVRVQELAVDGRATHAVVALRATTFGVRRRSVTVLSGATGRSKIIEIDNGDPALLQRLLTT